MNTFMYIVSRFKTNELRLSGVFSADCTRWRIEFFKDMRSVGLYCNDDYIEDECLNFCFMNILRDELDRTASFWNAHKKSGIPSVLAGLMGYLIIPEVSDSRDYISDVSLLELELAEERCCKRPPQCLLI